ncbi:hypothetical protein AB0Q95_33080 [Streptomyces sp. NPDC059900]|uniref:hypothetical protein n=1 Tax=Streptomyces sp. NPDC059900 TaxID=3155816 RepID=UPI0034425C58
MRKPLIVSAVCGSLLFMAGSPAMAADPVAIDSQGSKGPDRTVGAAAKITYTRSGNSPGSGPVTSVDPNWTPPPCWYAPEWKASEFGEYRDRLYFGARHDPDAPRDALKEMSDENQGYRKDNYNIDKEKEGMWWGAQFSPDATVAEQAKCSDPPFWVDNGDTPDVPNAISPEILAELAYNQIQVPGTKVSLAPDGPSKVNLPTWAWLDKGDFQPVSVTASLDVPGLHIEATTTAKPTALSIKPGTEDAVRIPASGKCEMNEDGSIGEPYAKGKANEEPPCGVTYHRSSGNGTYNLQATATWDITWTGSGGTGGDLPDGEYGDDQPVTVEEVQSVNR